MATNVAAGGADEPRDERPMRPLDSSTGTGFFTLYKPGQGYWTRMCTGVAIGLLILLMATFVWRELKTRTNLDTQVGPTGQLQSKFPAIKLAIVGSLVAISSFFAWKYFNKPAVVDFFIGTESEMKKVNWTSRKDLFGSTRVVLVFMLLISMVLFFYDIVFGYFFWLINILKHKPF